MRTVAIYTIDGVSKAKTAKAVLFECFRGTAKYTAWIPLSVCTLKFTGPEYKARLSVPDWMYNKISWKLVD